MHKSYGTGRRKTSSARVYLNEGTGVIKINAREVDDFIKSKSLKSLMLSPLEKSQLIQKVDLKITVSGGGQAGQVGAILHGLTRALVKYQSDLLPIMRREGFMTRDARKVERKKYGLKKARRAEQFTKR